MMLPWTRESRRQQYRLPWDLDGPNIGSGEICIQDSDGNIVCRLGASHSPRWNAMTVAKFIVKLANLFGGFKKGAEPNE